MRRWCRFKLIHPGSRAVRLVVALAAGPGLALSPLSTDTLLIHYDGHDIHTHWLGLDDVDSWVETPEHEHSAHEGGNNDFVIVLDLPDAVLRARGAGSVVIVARSAVGPWRWVTAVAPDPEVASPHRRSLFRAFTLRPKRAVAGLLLTSHALLL